MPMPGVKAEVFPEIAQRLGITVQHVWDLASHADEVASSLSIRQANELSLITGLRLERLIGIDPNNSNTSIGAPEFCAIIRERISSVYPGISEFEDAAGWSVEEFLRDPERFYDVANWDCLRDIASCVGVDPVSVLPDQNKQANKMLR